MLVDDIGDVTVTNDGATILKQMEVQHPAAKVLVDLSELQDSEVGDGTTSVVLLAAELLKRGNELVRASIHPTSVISGYKLAAKEACKYIQKNLSSKVESLGDDALLNVARTTISSKLIGSEHDRFAKMIVDAVKSVRIVTSTGETKYPVKSISVVKSHGRSMNESRIVPGYALKLGRAAQGMPTRVENAKIALVDFNLNKHRMGLGVQIQVEDAGELDKIRRREMDIAREKIQKIIDAGANVIVTSKGIDDMNLKYMVDAKAIGLRRVDKKDMRRIAKATGATVALTLSTLEGEEHFDPSFLGTCSEVMEERVGDNDFIFFQGAATTKSCTILLRGANEFMLDEIERSVHDALCAVSRTLESAEVCAGGGAVEGALAVYLEDFARTLGSREQLAIAEFAEALQVIPKTLAQNAAQDATELLARLRNAHSLAQQSDLSDAASQAHLSFIKLCTGKEDLKYTGLDLVNGAIRNNMKAGVMEPTVSKVKQIRFATEAAITILRIDDLINVSPAMPQM